jgi:hypothetical protein
MNLDEFLSQAGGDGPCVGILAASTATPAVAAGIELRTIDATQIASLDQLFDAFSHAWHFPVSFVRYRNGDAFDDWMRDFDNLCNPALDRPPAAGYLTHLTNAHRLLPTEHDIFSWFAHAIGFYRDYYRDDLDPPASFALLLSVPSEWHDQVCARWRAAGVPPQIVT